jgi:hypothetical protein
MFVFVQGQTDASRKWGELVEAFIFKELGLLARSVPTHALTLEPINNSRSSSVVPPTAFFLSAK